MKQLGTKLYISCRSIAESLLGLINLGLVRKSDLERYRQMDASFESNQVDFELIQRLHERVRPFYSNSKMNSRSALRQDIFALLLSDFKTQGFFVEFGACDGEFVSNTFLLESDFDWNGILCEPSRIWHSRLLLNRKSRIVTSMVWSESGKQIPFLEFVSAGLSTASSVEYKHSSALVKKKYNVETISLNDLLKRYDAPKSIDYISIDTEGSEYEILRNFNFRDFNISGFTIEHNYSDTEGEVNELLKENGYKRVLSSLSRYEGWYVHSSRLEAFSANFIDGNIE